MTDREWRERDQARGRAMAIGVIVAVAAVLRFWGSSGGLPSSLGVDEPQIMIRSFTMVKTGDFNPHFFDYPGLYLYLQAASSSRASWPARRPAPGRRSRRSATTTSTSGAARSRPRSAPPRCTSSTSPAPAGARAHALLAAALLAVLPIHVRESHYVLTDVPMTFFVTLALVLSLRAHEQGSVSAFAWAGAAAGLAAGTKYTAWVSVLMPLVAAGMLAGPFDVRSARARRLGGLLRRVPARRRPTRCSISRGSSTASARSRPPCPKRAASRRSPAG